MEARVCLEATVTKYAGTTSDLPGGNWYVTHTKKAGAAHTNQAHTTSSPPVGGGEDVAVTCLHQGARAALISYEAQALSDKVKKLTSDTRQNNVYDLQAQPGSDAFRMSSV